MYRLLYDTGELSCVLNEDLVKEFARLMSKERNVVAIVRLKINRPTNNTE